MYICTCTNKLNVLLTVNHDIARQWNSRHSQVCPRPDIVLGKPGRYAPGGISVAYNFAWTLLLPVSTGLLCQIQYWETPLALEEGAATTSFDHDANMLTRTDSLVQGPAQIISGSWKIDGRLNVARTCHAEVRGNGFFSSFLLHIQF